MFRTRPKETNILIILFNSYLSDSLLLQIGFVGIRHIMVTRDENEPNRFLGQASTHVVDAT